MSNTKSHTKNKIAAIDLGSNSFHLIVATLEDNNLKIIDSVKESVRLAEGLDDYDNLSQQKITKATDCLKIFGQRIKGFAYKNVQCVATNTLRKAQNSEDFIQQAQTALGFPISIIGGREEARLVYQGVARSISQTVDKRLVIDIGGGSTEFIVGEANKPILSESLSMGCLNFTQQFFSNGKITKKLIKKAILTARQKLEWISDEYIAMGWQETIGASGTIKSIAAILDARFDTNGIIYYKDLKKLADVFVDIKYIDEIELMGLSNSRSAIIIGGVCILLAAFEELDITSMMISTGALREGLLHDIRNLADGRDIRFTSVKQMQERYKVDVQQIFRINKIASVFINQLDLNSDTETVNLINWCIELHETGLMISHVNTPLHSAYIVEQSDMPGFSRSLQNTLGLLLRLHRGKVKKKLIEELPHQIIQNSMALLVIRLSIMLARGRNRINLEKMTITKTKNTEAKESIELLFPERYLTNRPLTVADLEQEIKETKKLGFELSFGDEKNAGV